MIVPSETFKKLVKLYSNRADLCELIGIDDSLLSLLMNRKRGASARVIETVCTKMKLPLGEAWEIVEGDGESD